MVPRSRFAPCPRGGAAGLGTARRPAVRDDDTDLVVQRKEGLYCPAGRLLHRPVAAGRSRRHHARARRSLAPRQLALPRRRAGRRRAANPPRRDRPADAALRRNDRPLRRSPQLSSRRPRSRLGAGAARARGARLGRVGRLLRRRQQRRRARGQPDLRAVRAGPLPLLHHRIDLRPADLSLAAAGRAVRRRSTSGGAPTPTPAAPACSSATPSARRSGS